MLILLFVLLARRRNSYDTDENYPADDVYFNTEAEREPSAQLKAASDVYAAPPKEMNSGVYSNIDGDVLLGEYSTPSGSAMSPREEITYGAMDAVGEYGVLSGNSEYDKVETTELTRGGLNVSGSSVVCTLII